MVKEFKEYDKKYYDPDFRTKFHSTADGRTLRLKEMDIEHLVNAVRAQEVRYADLHGFQLINSEHARRVRTAMYIGSAAYRFMQKELAYRRLILQHELPKRPWYDLHPDAVRDINNLEHRFCPPPSFTVDMTAVELYAAVDFAEEVHGCVSGRYSSTNANVSNHPKPKPKQPEYTMQHKNIISIIQQDYYTIGVKFPGTAQTYTYKVPNSLKLEKGDHVVTRRAGTKDGYGVAKVDRIDNVPQIDLDAPYEYAWIVQRIDAVGYEAQLELEEALKKELHQVEVAHQRHTVVEKLSKHLEPDSAAKKLFDSIVERSKQVLVGSAAIQAQDTLPSSVDNGQA